MRAREPSLSEKHAGSASLAQCLVARPSGGRLGGDERGIALIAVMSASSLLLALALSLALTTTVEVGIASNQRDGVQMLHAADAALERAIADLAAASDWDAMLATFVAGESVTLPDGERLDVSQETNRLRCGSPLACTDGDMDRATALRPWGRNNPRWTVYASGFLASLLPAGLSEAELATSRAYVVVWLADDPAENDAQPLRDGGPPAVVDTFNRSNPGRGAVWVHARAYGPSGSRRAVEAIVERDARWPPEQLRVRVWREIT